MRYKIITALKLSMIFLLTYMNVSPAFAASEGIQAPQVERELPLLRVLSYNVNGLPPPVKTKKMPLYTRIAEILRERRAAGTQPHIVLLQEAFDKRTATIAETTGYKYVFKGPGRRDRSKKGKVHWAPSTLKNYAQFSDPQKFTGSGLYILSDFPLFDAQYKVFDSDACAGIDCLSNKAIQFARIEVPFFEQPIDIVNSHFNSRSSAKAPGRITLNAHKKQTDVLSKYLLEYQKGYPVVLAGDFNTKQDKRYSYFKSQIPFLDVGEVCLSLQQACALGEGTKPAEILYNTNDKQFFESSDKLALEPVWVGRNFSELHEGRPLSDHLGYEVHYRLVSLD